MLRTSFIALALPLALLANQSARAETLIEVKDFDIDHVQVVGFELPRRAQIDIDAVGLRPRWGNWGDGMTAYAWILDSETRRPLWVLEDRGGSRVRGSAALRRFEKRIELEPGRYELYTYAGSRGFWNGGNFNFDLRGLRRLFDGPKGRSIKIEDDGNKKGSVRVDRYYDNDLLRDVSDCYVKLSSGDVGKGDLHEFEPTGDIPGALLRFTKLGDDEFVSAGFRVDRPMDLRIYSLMEFPDDWDYAPDRAWIVDARTRERVWELDDRHDTREAGGAEKNREFDGDVHLEAGEYILYCGTDGSHSYHAFNASPPYDPLNWGVTVLPGKDFDSAAFHTMDPPGRGEALVELTRARDGDSFEQPFRLKRETDVQIYAVGEYDGSHDFADRGWIQKSGSDEIVWEMTRRNTVHAGGADKNRMFDGTVRLPAGDYVAYYVTDDSHSYRDWNADPPYEPEAWGLAIYAGPGTDVAGFQKLSGSDIDEQSGVLARIARVGDRARKHAEFTLDGRERVHVYTIGEGTGREMYDFGYIVDKQSGDTVWEMTWRNTRYAGGADKNRVFDGEVMLEPGTYEVWYESDGSHSFASWNASPPRDPMHWGITVTRAQR